MPKRTVSSKAIASGLEAYGWKREIAGEDFDRAVVAIGTMYATGRGLLLTGDAGCGKTALMEAWRKCMNLSLYHWYYCKEQNDISLLRSLESDALNGTILLDDIGAEEIVKEYGNTVDIVGDFIQRYHYRGKGRFIATTNLNSNQINERYGGRILDRLLEMCVVMRFNGKTKRERIII